MLKNGRNKSVKLTTCCIFLTLPKSVQESLKMAGSLTYSVGFVDFDLHRHLEIFYIEMAVINLTYEKWPIWPSITD